MQRQNSDPRALRRLLSSLVIFAVVSIVGWMLMSHRREISQLRNEAEEMKSSLKQHEQVHQIESENADLLKQIETMRALETAVP